MEPAISKKILQDRYLVKLLAHRGVSFVICYITFKTRIMFKEHMKRGTHLLAPGPAGVEGRFVREIMSLLDGISVGGQNTRHRGFTPVMSVTKLSNLCKCLASTKFGSTVAMCLTARVVTRSLTTTTVSTEAISLCLASLTTGRVFCHFSMWGKDHH